jgi:hypothetical protein
MRTWHWLPRLLNVLGFSVQSIARSNKKLSKHSRARTWSLSWSRLYSVGKGFQPNRAKVLVLDSKMLLVR